MKTFVKQQGPKEFYVFKDNEHGELLGVFTTVEDAALFVRALRY